MSTLRKILDKVLITICIALFMFMTIIGTYQIVTRYVFNAPSTMSEELLTFSFTWMGLLSATYVFGKRDHMRMSFLADKLKGRAAAALAILTELVTMAFAVGVLTYGGVAITQLTMTQVTASLSVPMGVIYIVVPICGVLTIVYNLLNIYDSTKALKTGVVETVGSEEKLEVE